MKINRRYLLVTSVFAGAVLAGVTMLGCGSSATGTYADQSGAFVLNLKSGGDATFSFAGQSAMCTYKPDGIKINLTCEGQPGPLVLTVQDDGSLIGPPGSFMPPLRKK